MQKLALLAAITLALGLGACTTATPYQPLAPSNTVSGGFSEQKLDDTHYRVSFKGNDLTPRSQVETYLLYRAAELTAVQGDDWFEMADNHTHDTTHTFVDRDRSFGFGWGYWRPDWTWFDEPGFAFGGPYRGGYDVEREDAYLASAVIAMGKGPKPAGDTAAFDARQVMQNLSAKIVRPH